MLKKASKYQENSLKMLNVSSEEPLFNLYFYWKTCKKPVFWVRRTYIKTYIFKEGH